MFNTFSTAEALITEQLIRFAVFPISILSAGIATLAVSALLLWMTYKSYMVMAGLVSDPLPTILVDLGKKIAIFTFAASLSGLHTQLVIPFMETQASLAKDFSGGAETSLFANIESHISQVAILFEASTGLDEAKQTNLEALTAQRGEPLGFFEWAWTSITDAWDKVETAVENAGGIWSLFMVTVNIALVMIGLVIMGVAAFIPIILNKIFFMLGLGFAPLFIMFLAFDSTKSWFSSWLNSTIGYCLSYPLAMMVVTVLLSIYSQMYNQDSLTFVNSIVCLVTSLVFAVIISRIGDVASNWFSAQNIADGTTAAVGLILRKPANYAAKSTINATQNTARGAINLGKRAANQFKRTKLTNGEK